MVKGLPQKLFLGQDYRSPLSAKVFSSWDFCIRGQGAAAIKKHEISNEFKVCVSVGALGEGERVGTCVWGWVQAHECTQGVTARRRGCKTV